MTLKHKHRARTNTKPMRKLPRKRAPKPALAQRAPSGTTHVTPPGGNIFADLGFPDPEAAALLRESRKRIDAELAKKQQQRLKPQMTQRQMREAMRKLIETAVPSYPAPPGSVPPARWLPIRQAAAWRREIERDLAAGKPLPDFSTEGVLTLRRFAEHEYSKVNDICIADDLTLVRFVGVGENQYDFYYVCERLGVPPEKRRVYWTAVGECLSLRGRLDAKMYERIEKGFCLNGCYPVKQMLILREVRGVVVNRPGKEVLDEMRAYVRGDRAEPFGRLISETPVNMTLEDLRDDIHAVMRGERKPPKLRRKTKRKKR